MIKGGAKPIIQTLFHNPSVDIRRMVFKLSMRCNYPKIFPGKGFQNGNGIQVLTKIHRPFTKGTFIMEDQCALIPSLWQTSLFRLQNVKLMMTTYNNLLMLKISR